MKKRYLLLILLTMFIMPLGASAACSSERLAELSKIAENVDIDYTYEIGTTDAEFTVVFSNLTKDIYIIDLDSDLKYEGNGEVKSEVTFWSGQSKVFSIYSNDANCKAEPLTSKYITFPKYNVYSSYSACHGYETYKLCKQWADLGDMSETEFLEKMEAYKKSLEKENTTEKKGKEPDVMKEDMIIISIVVGIIIILLITMILLYVKKHKKNKLL